MSDSSTPHLEEFDPTIIPFQKKVLYDIKRFDYSKGVHQILLSGSVGSSKSLLMSHVVIRHCLDNPGARALIGRKALPALRKTLWQKIKDHLLGCQLIKGIHYKVNETRLEIKFCNGSEIISQTWADGDYEKFGSLELSLVAIEEFTENTDDGFFKKLRPRVGRLPKIKTNLIIGATNPDSPSHWLHEYFIESDDPFRHVYYSLTEENPFLPDWYIKQLKTDLDPRMAERLLRGKWVEINSESIYYAYDKAHNFRKSEYQIDKNYPVRISWDFNIATGKPLSAVLFQYIDHKDEFHFFDEVVVEGFRTADSVEEMDARGLLSNKYSYIIHGDAAGFAKNTRSVHNDYDIIKKYFSNHPDKLQWQIQVPAANPGVRDRHTLVNGYCLNDLKQRRLFIYEKAKTADKGLRLTQLKQGANYIEDDGPKHPWQHISTAMGYGMNAEKLWRNSKPSGSRAL